MNEINTQTLMAMEIQKHLNSFSELSTEKYGSIPTNI